MSFRGSKGNDGNTFLKNLPFGLAYTDVNTTKPTEMPTIPLPVNNPIMKKERSLAVTYINYNNVVKNGPFYTGAVTDSQDSEVLNHDGIERYSDRYLKKRKLGASIDEHPYHLALFPKELHNVMGINKKKLMKIHKLENNSGNIFTGAVDDATLGLSVLEKLKQLADNEEDENPAKTNEDSLSDNDYEEDDEEDEDNDYNAEKYFDDGDDEGYGDDDDNGDEPAF